MYPLVEESEKIDLKSATEGFESLSSVFRDYKVGLLHGKMNSIEKNDIMEKFKKNEINLLVSTTVIEVGIDVPNSTFMIIQHADRFGLTQLHQLRGRIGRGGTLSYCFLIADPKNENSKKRIKAMVETTDGFKISEYDLMIRGPGDVLGVRQSGMPDFKIANLVKDEKILIAARLKASKLIEEDPELCKHENYSLRKKVEKFSKFVVKELN